jgi:ABC-2 type transport system ATP-binding protein
VLVTEKLPTRVGTGSFTVRDLHVEAPDGRPLINGANASFQPGVTALLGPNGAGKSTLLRTIALAHPLAGGSVTLDGLDGSRNRRAFLERLMFLPQNFATYPELTGQEFLEYSMRLRGAGRRAAASVATSWLEAVGLTPAAATPTGAYSQGMRQRLGFAYAMQIDVRVYLLDEPFAGVDPESREILTDLLFTLASDRFVIVSTHHVDEMTCRGAAVCKLDGGSLVM